MSTPPLTPRQIQEAGERSLHKPYWFRCWRAFDKFLNGITGGNEDETISDRVWRVTMAHPGYRGPNPLVYVSKGLNWVLNDIQKDHGALAAAGTMYNAAQAVHDEAGALGVDPKNVP